MALEELRFCAKYPFTNEAKNYLDSLKIDLNNIDFGIIEASGTRIMNEINTVPTYFKDPLDLNKVGKEPPHVEITTYPISKILVSLSEDNMLKKKFAGAEAQKVYRFLQSEETDVVERIAKQFFKIEREKDHFLVPFNDYLAYPSEEKQYALVNLELDKGRVRLDKEMLAKLVSQYVYRSIIETKVDKRDIRNKDFIFFADKLKKDKKYTIPEDLGKVELEAFPPCMTRIYRDLQNEQNVGHISRFVFSTFLAGIRMPIEEAINLFRNQANFNESKTRYYLEHSYGLKSNRTKYSVPACSKMESYGVCYRDATCHWSHPMSYYAKTKKVRK